MRIKALLLFAALPLAGCPQETTPAALPPAGLAGGAAPGAPSSTGMPAGHPSVAQGAASQPAAPEAAAPRTAPHPPMNTVNPGTDVAAPASQPASPAAPTVIPGGGAAHVEGAAELSGTVTEAHHVKEYTYLRVKDASGNESWAAVLKDESIGVGARVALGKDIWMSDFQSPSMGRTFDRILFGRVLSKQ